VVRHGETDWNVAGILQGWLDVPLNEQGHRQSEELAERCAGAGFTSVWSSPLQRSLETAEIVAAALGLPEPICHPGLMERNFGAIQGIPKSELGELNPVLLQQILRRNPAAHFENGETMDEFADRVLNSLRELGAEHGGECVLLVTHGWVMDVITRHVLGLPRSTILNLKRKNGEAVWLAVTACSVVRDPDGHMF